MIYNDYKFQIPKEKMIRVITDTDAKNEADDQFAIVQAILSPRFDNVGFIAAHYGDRHPDSMLRSYLELELIFEKMNLPSAGLLYKGNTCALVSKDPPQITEGAALIIREALAVDDRPLFVIFFGPLTDLAAAYLIDPSISGKLTAIWIGGGAYPSGGQEFNLGNDVLAANIVFESGIDIWQVPKNVYEMMPVSLAELECRVAPHGEIGKYLLDQLVKHSFEEDPRKSDFRTGETWVLGDSPAVGLLLYEHRFAYKLYPPPFILDDLTYIHNIPERKNLRPIRVYQTIDSRLILEDLYCKLELFAKKSR